MAHSLWHTVMAEKNRPVHVNTDVPISTFGNMRTLIEGIHEQSQVWMSHGDTITAIPENFKIIASTDKVAIFAYQVKGEKVWGIGSTRKYSTVDEKFGY